MVGADGKDRRGAGGAGLVERRHFAGAVLVMVEKAVLVRPAYIFMPRLKSVQIYINSMDGHALHNNVNG